MSYKTLYGDCIVMCDILQHLLINRDITVSRHILCRRLTSHYMEMLAKLSARPHFNIGLFAAMGARGWALTQLFPTSPVPGSGHPVML